MDSPDSETRVSPFSFPSQQHGFVMNPFFKGLSNPLPPETTLNQLIEAKRSGRLSSLDCRMREYVRSRLEHDYCFLCKKLSTNSSAGNATTNSKRPLNLVIDMNDESTWTASEDEVTDVSQSGFRRLTFEKALRSDSTVDTHSNSSQDSETSHSGYSESQNELNVYISGSSDSSDASSTQTLSDDEENENKDDADDEELSSEENSESSSDSDVLESSSPLAKRKKLHSNQSQQSSKYVSSCSNSTSSSSKTKAIRIFNSISLTTNTVCPQSDQIDQTDLRSLARKSSRKSELEKMLGSNQITAMGAIRATTAVIPTSL